jgi:hypothetical protein
MTEVSRRQLLALAASSALIARQPSERKLILLTGEDAERIRTSLDTSARNTFAHLADQALRAGPWSVTFHRPSGGLTKPGPHDYFSEGPYWWPDPQNPNGPYIRHDGERNPKRFMDNHRDLDDVCSATLALGVGALFLNKPGCVEHAARILSAWFVDPATRMNPNLEFGQAIRGITEGRGTGLIDTVSLIHCVQGIALLNTVGSLARELLGGLRDWFSQFLHWMITSKKGLDEKKSGNNHATWWAAQVAAYASFLNDNDALQLAFTDYRTYLVPSEIRPDGSCPREEQRTNSLSYSCFNLDAFSVLGRIAQVQGVDLWHFEAPNGGSVAKACNYLLPFVLNPATWPHQQIGAFNPDSLVFPALAGLGLRSTKLLNAYANLPHAKGAWTQLVTALLS